MILFRAENFTTRFKQNSWAVFLLHQGVVFLSAVLFISLFQRLTGRDIHLGAEPIGWMGGIALMALSAGIVAFTAALYRWVKGPDTPALGLGLSLRRAGELVIGLLLGTAVVFLPWMIALWSGGAGITGRIGAHFDRLTATAMIAGGFALLLAQAIAEETANRAFPIRLWEDRILLYRLLVPAVFFAAVHLVSEEFSTERAAVLLMAGVVQGLAYLITGNIWFTSGLHAGANYALFSISGLWHAGAVVSVIGNPAYPNWISVVIMLIAIAGVWGLKRFRTSQTPIPDP